MKNYPKTEIAASTRKLIASALTVLLATGCATPFNDYDGASTRAAFANICQSRGLITSDDFAHYSALQMGWGTRQNMTIVDDAKHPIDVPSKGSAIWALGTSKFC